MLNLLLGPFILTTNLIFFLRGEVILDVESLTNLLRRLALDHIGNGLAAHVEKSLDIEVVGGLSRYKSVSLARVILC